MRFVLGMGGTVDYEIRWDPSVLERLAVEHGVGPEDLDLTTPVGSVRDLVRSLLAFVRDGVGGERFVASSDIVEEMAARFDKAVTLGGTCVRAAIAMDVLGVPSTVHLVSIDENVRRLLPRRVDHISSATQDSLDPHLIVQYPAGATVRLGEVELVAPRPNRIIYANDPPHRELRIADDLPGALHRADVFLLSSFNVIQDPATLDDRLARVRQAMLALRAGALVMFEDAGFHVPALSVRVRDEMAGVVDVYSLNEDEMQAYLGHRVDLLDPLEVARAVGELRTLVPAPTLVVHTQHWALAVGERGATLGPALRGGIVMASTRYRLGDGFTADDYASTAALPPGGRAARVCAEVARLLGAGATVVPALDLSAVPTPTTIGLGDTFVGGFLAALDA
ncbi:ADP-dependent glucokinase/phosphofructokinase [Actinotalea sp. K2]|uniref:ADP-dependent glucokinase/phosphofructokinase n=1 Tax=Actinotalea sp. K2 TaxID=2939438 RepID=UPI002016D5A1|nr:ADP-dependent glucokinase/phosphofructokinase [Actinotalea sp. K2]MCL3861180.1 ADP-dependent glucokinase/phosphofructokinase [Actinotalea sp. K2]